MQHVCSVSSTEDEHNCQGQPSMQQPTHITAQQLNLRQVAGCCIMQCTKHALCSQDGSTKLRQQLVAGGVHQLLTWNIIMGMALVS